jgi:hypothetical protein
VSQDVSEPIFGVGMDDLPPQNFLQSTRRVPLVAIDVGGRTVKKDLSATWINYEHGARKIGPLGMPGLLGHQALADYRVILDFPGQRMALTQSQRALLAGQGVSVFAVMPGPTIRSKLMLRYASSAALEVKPSVSPLTAAPASAPSHSGRSRSRAPVRGTPRRGAARPGEDLSWAIGPILSGRCRGS